MTVEDTVAGPTRVMLVALPLMSWGLERLLEGDHGRWSVVGVVESAAEGVLRGAYRFARFGEGLPQRVVLMASGAIVGEALRAAQALETRGVGADVISVTSWSELARDGVACEQRALAGEEGVDPGTPWLATQLAATSGPVVAATDYVRAVPETVRAFIPEGRKYITLGTDGFGRSDTRAALRSFFHVDATSIAQAALRG